MTRFSWRVWFSRLIVAAAAFIMSTIALRSLRDPIGATRAMGMVLTTPTAITVFRVGFGGFPLGFAIALLGCLISTRRLLTGVSLVAAVLGAATLARIQGLLVDGATSYNLALLRPEVVMLTLSLVAIVVERRRRRHSDGAVRLGAALQPSVSR
jgi:hypothetical protein